jgi:hypothetical protein
MENRRLAQRILGTVGETFIGGWDQKAAIARLSAAGDYDSVLQIILQQLCSNPGVTPEQFGTTFEEVADACGHIGKLYGANGIDLLARTMYDPDGFGEPGQDFAGCAEVYDPLGKEVVRKVFFGGAEDEDALEDEANMSQAMEKLSEGLAYMRIVAKVWEDAEYDNLDGPLPKTLIKGWEEVNYPGSFKDLADSIGDWAEALGAKEHMVSNAQRYDMGSAPQEIAKLLANASECLSDVWDLWAKSDSAFSEKFSESYPPDVPSFDEFVLSFSEWSGDVTKAAGMRYSMGQRILNNTNGLELEVWDVNGIDDYALKVVDAPETIDNLLWVSGREIDGYVKKGVYAIVGLEDEFDTSIASREASTKGHREFIFLFNGWSVNVSHNPIMGNTKSHKYYTFVAFRDGLIVTGEVTTEYDRPSGDWEIEEIRFDGGGEDEKLFVRGTDIDSAYEQFAEGIDLYA